MEYFNFIFGDLFFGGFSPLIRSVLSLVTFWLLMWAFLANFRLGRKEKGEGLLVSRSTDTIKKSRVELLAGLADLKKSQEILNAKMTILEADVISSKLLLLSILITNLPNGPQLEKCYAEYKRLGGNGEIEAIYLGKKSDGKAD
jgi:hypothetical protein